MPSAATCVAKRQSVCVSQMPANTKYNSGPTESCVAQVTTAYTDAKLTQAESVGIDTACLGVFDGPGAKNATCAKDLDCAVSTGLRCVLTAGSSTGSCQTPQVVQGGGSCAAMDAQCVTGFHCGTSAHCDVNAALQETCGPTIPCAPDLRCDGTCVAKGADGTTCTTADECLHGICNRASTSPSGLCVSQVTLSPDAQFCIESRD